MIVAVTQNSSESYMAFKKFNLVKKERAAFIIAPVLLVVLGVPMLFFQFVFGIVLIGAALVLPALMYLSMILASKKFLKRGREYLSTATRYEFSKETMRVVSLAPGKDNCVEGSFRYEEIHGLYETPTYFYFYLTNARCLILPKKDITEGSPEALSALLKERLNPFRKYIFRK